MTTLPTIACNGYFFTPKGPVSDESYSISTPMESDCCIITIFKKKVPQANPQEVDPFNSLYPIDRELEIMSKTKARSTLSRLGVFVSFVVSAYLFGIRKNYKFGAVGAVLAGSCAISAWYFNRQCRKASFDAANRVICLSQNKQFLRSEYGLS